MGTNSRSRGLSRRGYKPGAIISGKELVSYPWSLPGGTVLVNARNTIGDPTSMETFEISWDDSLIHYYQTCEYCHKAKPDVHERPDGYRQDVHNEPDAVHTACDACDRECNRDI